MKDCYVYTHKRNDTNEIFYVGKGRGNRADSLVGRNAKWLEITNAHGRTVEYAAIALEPHEAVLMEVRVIALLVKSGAPLVNSNNVLRYGSKRELGSEYEGDLRYQWRNVWTGERKFCSVWHMVVYERCDGTELDAILDGETVVTHDGWCFNEPKWRQT